MTVLNVWPTELPPELRQLPALVAGHLGLPWDFVKEPVEADGAHGPLLVILNASAFTDGSSVLDQLDRWLSSLAHPAVLVVGDGWLGTDGPDTRSAVLGAGAVALTRSIAVRRTRSPRVNVVCVPEGLFGPHGSQRGPLPYEITSSDVAEVVAFALGDQSGYITGQVLFANGGRQLFSSLTA